MDRSQDILNFFKKASQNGKLSHGYLFWGGIIEEMKKTAFDLANFLKIDRFDILYIIPDKDKQDISIDQIRSAKKHLSLSPYNSQYKFAIIDNAQTLSQEASDALLKTLEEPIGSAILIVIVSNSDLLPQTIVSRLEKIRFKAMPLSKVSEQIINKEHIEILTKPINDIFKYIEKTSKNCKENKDDTEFFGILDSWMLWFREKMLRDNKYATAVREIQKSREMISGSNVNPRLVLENLILEIYV